MSEVTKVALPKEAVYAQVLEKVNKYRNSGELALPRGYSAENAIQSAQLVIAGTLDKNKRPALEVCTKASIAQALLDTVLQGLNPGKKQCYYIVYGNTLVMQRSYFGEMHVAKSVCPDIEGIYPEVVYEGDIFEYSKHRGRTVVDKHHQKLENVNSNNIVAAYCTVIFKDGHEETAIMTISEIHAAWRKSKQSPFDNGGKLNPNSTHGQYPAEMARKTVVRRACKAIINSSDDSNLLIIESINRTADAASDAETDAIIAENNGIIDVDINDPPMVDPDTGEVIEEPITEAAPY